ncbi:MAG: transglycosylase domain-containing protein [Lachnospiraceae bacterium]
MRLFGALAANVRGSYAQGASTITMQLIRQSHLSTQKTLARKLEEIYLAIVLERRMSKDEILGMYLNYIYFGNGAYGIQAAAQTYFGVDAAELTPDAGRDAGHRHQGAVLLRPVQRRAQPGAAQLHFGYHAVRRHD